MGGGEDVGEGGRGEGLRGEGGRGEGLRGGGGFGGAFNPDCRLS